MKLNKLEKATQALASVKKLDAEILEFEQFAMKVANGDLSCSFTLNLEDLTKKKKADTVEFDEDGSIVLPSDRRGMHERMMRDHYLFITGMRTESASKADKKNTTQLKNNLTERATLQILGLLLYEKQSIRNGLLRDLKKMGVEI